MHFSQPLIAALSLASTASALATRTDDFFVALTIYDSANCVMATGTQPTTFNAAPSACVDAPYNFTSFSTYVAPAQQATYQNYTLVLTVETGCATPNRQGVGLASITGTPQCQNVDLGDSGMAESVDMYDDSDR